MTDLSNETSPDLERMLSGLPPEDADSLRRTWNLAEASTPSVDEAWSDAVWRVLSDAANAPEGAARPMPVMSPRASMHAVTWLRAAAAVAAFAVVAAAMLLLQPLRADYAANAGETLSITLPDGSFASLNSGTNLQYRDGLWRSRRVRLDGEAYFDVVAGSRLFEVETFNADVRVVGTRFNVRARYDDHEPATVVSVGEGQVDIFARGIDDKHMRLTRGQRARVDALTVQMLDEPAGDDDAGAWREGDLIFKDESLGVVLDEVARRFDVRLQTGTPELLSIRLSLALREAIDVETILGAACVALDLRYRPVSGGFEIYSPASS